MLNLNYAQAQNSYNNRMQCGANNYQNVCQGGFGQNPAMMMAMTMMAACMMKMMSQMSQNLSGMCPGMANGGFGNNYNGQNGSGCGLNDFLGGQNNGGCNNNYSNDNQYRRGLIFDNPAHNNNNEYHRGLNFDQNPNDNYDNNNSGNDSGTRGTGKTSGVGKDLPEGINNISYAKACEMVKNAAGQLNPDGKPTVLAIRSDNTSSRSYQDAFLVLKPDGTMEKFSANTRPSKGGQNKAMLKNGEYNIKPRWQDGKWQDAFIVGSSHDNNNVAVSRDKNGDGQYSESELNSKNSSDTIRLHRGNKNGTTSSAGCLNVKDYDGFLDALGGRKTEFNMVLVTM